MENLIKKVRIIFCDEVSRHILGQIRICNSGIYISEVKNIYNWIIILLLYRVRYKINGSMERWINISLSSITCNLIIGDEWRVKTRYFRNPNPIRMKSLSNTIYKSVNFIFYSFFFSFSVMDVMDTFDF